ncbi:hypothetical protein N9L19_01500, partial [bacterium]|nr:hypothetical protein [bacterium]
TNNNNNNNNNNQKPNHNHNNANEKGDEPGGGKGTNLAEGQMDRQPPDPGKVTLATSRAIIHQYGMLGHERAHVDEKIGRGADEPMQF